MERNVPNNRLDRLLFREIIIDIYYNLSPTKVAEGFIYTKRNQVKNSWCASIALTCIYSNITEQISQVWHLVCALEFSYTYLVSLHSPVTYCSNPHFHQGRSDFSFRMHQWRMVFVFHDWPIVATSLSSFHIG